MRLYSFVNTYLSPLQHGLQTAHCVADMFVKYRFISSSASYQLNVWAEDHKTIIILNGGNQANLFELLDFIYEGNNNFPFEEFSEDEQSLNNCLTCVSIILPERIYGAAAESRPEYPDSPPNDPSLFTPWEIELINKLKQYRLA